MVIAAAGSQEPIAVPPAAHAEPAFYYNDGGATLPEPLPATHSFPKLHCKKSEGLLVLGAVVDANGDPQQITIIRSAGSELDASGRAYVSAERFKPGVLNGEPVAVAVELELQLQGCKQLSAGSNGPNAEQPVLVAEPAQMIEGAPPPWPDPSMTALQFSNQTSIPGVEHVRTGISPPRAVKTPPVDFSPPAKKFKIQGTCLVQLIVDAKGEPTHIRLVRSLAPSLDQEALRAVAQWRFRPATREGQPVPVIITIEVAFRLR